MRVWALNCICDAWRDTLYGNHVYPNKMSCRTSPAYHSLDYVHHVQLLSRHHAYRGARERLCAGRPIPTNICPVEYKRLPEGRPVPKNAWLIGQDDLPQGTGAWGYPLKVTHLLISSVQKHVEHIFTPILMGLGHVKLILLRLIYGLSLHTSYANATVASLDTKYDSRDLER